MNAPPDGYTLLLVGASSAINATLYEKLNFNFLRDIAPVAGIISIPFIMAVNPSFPAKTVSEFIAYAKANPGKVNMASGGNGTAGHLSGELFKMMAGVNMVHVPYRGEGPALTDHARRASAGDVRHHARIHRVHQGWQTAAIGGDKCKALGGCCRTSRRSAILCPGYETSAWQGVGAPRNTSAEIIDKLNKEINAGLADPKIKARVADMGGTVLAGSPADFGKLIAEETEKWGKVVKFSGIKPD